MFAAMLFTGAISDRYGRKIAVGLAAVASFIFGILRAFSPNYTMYVIMHFFEAGFGGGLYPSAYVLSEYTLFCRPAERRRRERRKSKKNVKI